MNAPPVDDDPHSLHPSPPDDDDASNRNPPLCIVEDDAPAVLDLHLPPHFEEEEELPELSPQQQDALQQCFQQMVGPLDPVAGPPSSLALPFSTLTSGRKKVFEKTTLQAHVCCLSAESQVPPLITMLHQDPKFHQVRNWMYAYRLRVGEDMVVGYADGGEQGSGERLLRRGGRDVFRIVGFGGIWTRICSSDCLYCEKENENDSSPAIGKSCGFLIGLGGRLIREVAMRCADCWRRVVVDGIMCARSIRLPFVRGGSIRLPLCVPDLFVSGRFLMSPICTWWIFSLPLVGEEF